MNCATIVVTGEDSDGAADGCAEQEISERFAGEITAEAEVAVVIAGGEAQGRLANEPPDVEAGFNRVAAMNPGEVVYELSIRRDRESWPAFAETRVIGDGKIRQAVKENVLLNVF